MRARTPLSAIVGSIACILVTLPAPQQTAAQGGGPDSPINVFWSVKDSVTACPAGDSVLAGRPSRLRIAVRYEEQEGVPPDSIWVTYSTASGNVKINDKGANINADDSTRTLGDTRITIPSLSGCGVLNLSLYVSGVYQGTKTATVRTTDYNADGRVSSFDELVYCDLNYDSLTNNQDRSLVTPEHRDHWRRNALHGSLVRRTNLKYAGIGRIGESQVFWSPSGRWLSYTVHGPVTSNACHVFLVPSDPAIGNQPRQFTWSSLHDYDPSWSPLNTDIAFARGDYQILRKGVYGQNPDTTEYVVVQSGNAVTYGDVTPAISANGQWIAFSRKKTPDYHIWKTPMAGGDTIQLTFTPNVADQYPTWSSEAVPRVVLKKEVA